MAVGKLVIALAKTVLEMIICIGGGAERRKRRPYYSEEKKLLEGSRNGGSEVDSFEGIKRKLEVERLVVDIIKKDTTESKEVASLRNSDFIL